jgi:2-acylglycerol O-acyltransferase 2
VVGKPIPVKKQSEPSNEYVQEKLNEFVAAMESLYARHKGKHGYAESTLVVL